MHMDVPLLRHLKVELAWLYIDEWLLVISNIMLFVTIIPRRCSHFKFKQYCMHCYVVLRILLLIVLPCSFLLRYVCLVRNLSILLKDSQHIV